MDTATTSMPQDDRLAHIDGLATATTPTTTLTTKASISDGCLVQASDLPDLRIKQKQTEIIERIFKLQTDLIEKNSECERLKIKLEESSRAADILGRELDECKLTMLQNSEDSKKVHEEVQRNRTLEEDHVKLMSNFLNLSERYERDRQSINDKFIAKTNAINHYESLMSRDALTHELNQCRAELELKQTDASLLGAKLKNMEEDNSVKEKCITELKKSLDDAKVTHKHEITVLEEYVHCLKNTITSYEKTLATYIDEKPHEDEKPDEGSSLSTTEAAAAAAAAAGGHRQE